MKKLLITAATLGGSVLPSLAEGAAPTQPETITGYFTPWITTVSSAMLSLFAAGAVIVGTMFAWRVLKRVFSGSK